MTIISSQHYIDWDIVETKMDELQGMTEVEIPCYYVGEIDGEEYAMQADGHHTLMAARELGIEVRYVVDDDPEGLTGEELLDARWMDGDWYDVEASDPSQDNFRLIF